MIKEKKLERLKRILLNSKNPLFLFDNDPDGICSAAILLKNIKKGKALVLRTINKINTKVLKKIFSSYPSEIFILDKPLTDEEFVKTAKEKNTPLIIVDHHKQKKKKYCLYFNSYPSSEPTSYIAQKIFNSKETKLLSLIGCVYDVFIPEFLEEEKEKYPELFLNKKDPLEIVNLTEFGKAVQILSLSLMNGDEKVIKILDYILKINSPYDILFENKENQFMHEKYKELKAFIDKNLEKAKVFENLVFLEFSGKHSLSSEIANKLLFLYKNKFIIACYKKEDAVNISLRGENAINLVKTILKKIDNSIGGGHEKACGLKIPLLEYEKFKKIVSKKFSIKI